jgi:hypothetical protein
VARAAFTHGMFVVSVICLVVTVVALTMVAVLLRSARVDTEAPEAAADVPSTQR